MSGPVDGFQKEIDYAKGRELLPLLGSWVGERVRDTRWLAEELCGGAIAEEQSLIECSGTYRFGTPHETEAEEIVLTPTGTYSVEIYSIESEADDAHYSGAYRVVTTGGERRIKTVDVNTRTLQEFVDAAGDVTSVIHLEPAEAVTAPGEGHATVLNFTKPDGTTHTFQRV